ncbi:MAG: dihydropteroate synthase [Burkholderiales bacterium]|nr:dihydropteroate synthase [Phycisphaerae bacterium]
MDSSSFTRWLTSTPRPPLVMGVLNVTPDSFSDGGEFLDASKAVDHARRMIDDGADLIDIGGESTRPGAQRVEAAEQIRRVVPVIERVARLGVAVSIDTTLAEVARAAIGAGAAIVNDISAATEDAGMTPLIAQSRCPVILMHMQREPGTMQINPTYDDVVREVTDYLVNRAHALEAAGVERHLIVLDPGFGFGKTVEHNLQLLRQLDRLVQTGYPVLVGTSRKSFIAQTLSLKPGADRTFGTAATIAWAVTNGAGIVRVHDVGAMKQVVRMTQAIQQGNRTGNP